MTKDTPDSLKILMLAEAGFQPIPLARKYLKLVRFVKEIEQIKCTKFSEDNCWKCASCKAKQLLREIEEIE
jgi:hypothetical protein